MIDPQHKLIVDGLLEGCRVALDELRDNAHDRHATFISNEEMLHVTRATAAGEAFQMLVAADHFSAELVALERKLFGLLSSFAQPVEEALAGRSNESLQELRQTLADNSDPLPEGLASQ